MREAIGYLFFTALMGVLAFCMVHQMWSEEVDSLGKSIERAREHYNRTEEPTREDVEEIRRMAITRADYLTHKPFFAMNAEEREQYNDACTIIRRCNVALVTIARYSAASHHTSPAPEEPWFMKPESALDKRHRR